MDVWPANLPNRVVENGGEARLSGERATILTRPGLSNVTMLRGRPVVTSQNHARSSSPQARVRPSAREARQASLAPCGTATIRAGLLPPAATDRPADPGAAVPRTRKRIVEVKGAGAT